MMADPDLTHAIQAAMPASEAADYVRALKDRTPFIKQRQACDQAADALERVPQLERDLHAAHTQIDRLRKAAWAFLNAATPSEYLARQVELRAALDLAVPEQTP
jgi:hypothetical protein